MSEYIKWSRLNLEQMEFEDRPSATYFLVQGAADLRYGHSQETSENFRSRSEKRPKKHKKRPKWMKFFDIIVGKDYPHNVHDVENQENDLKGKEESFEGVSFPACRHNRK